MARILIVDHDPDVVEAVRLVLDKDRHTVSTACSREEGLAALATRTFDLVILDAMMEQPDDGIAMAQQLRRKGLTTPILMLAGADRSTGPASADDAQLPPASAVIAKPVQADALIARVDGLLAGWRG